MEDLQKSDIKTNEEQLTAEKNNKPLNIDFDSLFASNRDEPPAQVVVVPSSDRRSSKKRKKSTADDSSSAAGGGDDLSLLLDYDLKLKIARLKENIAKMGRTLKDNGEKLKALLQRCEDELQHRLLRRSQEVDNICKKSTYSAGAHVNDELLRDEQSSESSQQSQFAACLMKKLEENTKPKLEQNTGDRTKNAFDLEISSLNHCDKRQQRTAALSKKANPALFSKQFSTWKPRNGSRNCEKRYKSLNGYFNSKAPSAGLHHQSKEKLAGSFTDMDTSAVKNVDGLKNEKTVVLVDEDEAELLESKREADDLPSSTTEGKIYYPSREDPESLEIFRSELRCLEPGECLTSTIMNFYIRFLQETSSERLRKNYYFFNTYFYSKLQKAVAHKKSDKEAFFVKFRRWWRGVNIFQKAYIFLPINEDKHWSLVIICIPDKEDESGPILLHLDSLGLHFSQLIFDNIKSLLKNEQEFINEDGGAGDIPISDRIWKYLDRRIDERIITVPRQTNDYDCGLFVLYYIERFMEEAPDRLRRKHLDNMFGKNWFKPQEASSLRGKMKKILQEEFHKALQENDSMFQAVCLSVNTEAAKP